MKRIAIIEDEAAIRDNYVEMLEGQGYQVQGFADRPSAERALFEQLPDLAIVDIGLGNEIDGLCCAKVCVPAHTPANYFFNCRDSEIDTVCGSAHGGR